MKIPFHNPIFRVIGGFVIVLLLIAVAIAINSAINGRNPLTAFSVILLMPLAMIAGPFMGATYPGFGIPYISALIVMLVITIVGFMYRNKLIGQISAFAGITGWFLLGMFGLGTGT